MNKKITFFLLRNLKQFKTGEKSWFFFLIPGFLLTVAVFIFYFQSIFSYVLPIGISPAVALNNPDLVVPDEVLIKYKQSSEIIKYKIDPANYSSALNSLKNNADLEFIEPNYLYHAAIIPSDTYYTNQWYLKKIKAVEAWDEVRESPNIIIAIIDTGVQITHPDLKENIWHNPNEILNNHIDDDKNGYVDDINGWDFINNVANPEPKFAKGYTQDGILHGTIVAGIAAAAGNNANGISGVAWNAQIMPIKALDDKGAGDTSNVIKAINYAIDNRADIINLSFVGYNYSKSLELAIKRAYDNGVIVVAAAGNEQKQNNGHSLDRVPYYPVCYDGKNGENMVLGVTATDAVDQKTAFAGYGFKCVDLAAPGVSIFSATYYAPEKAYNGVPFNKYYDGYWSGTSMAVPMVSGALALVEAANPYLDKKELLDLVLNKSDNINRLNPSYLSQLGRGRVNVAAAVSEAKRLLMEKNVRVLTAPMSNNSLVKITDKVGKTEIDFYAYDKNFKGGVNITAGDINGDGQDEIITGAGPGGGPHVKIFSASSSLISQFFAYNKNFKGGVNIAAGDINGDGQDEIITGAGPGGEPQVKVFNNQIVVVSQFYAYNKNFKGGVNIAAGDINGDGKDEIITGAGPGGGPHVRVFNSQGLVISEFFAYDKNFKGGVKVATANIDRRTRDQHYEIVTAPGKGTAVNIKIFNHYDVLVKQFLAYDKKFKEGASVAALDINYDGYDEIVTGAGSGGGPHVRIFKDSGILLNSFYAREDTFLGGINVGRFK